MPVCQTNIENVFIAQDFDADSFEDDCIVLNVAQFVGSGPSDNELQMLKLGNIASFALSLKNTMTANQNVKVVCWVRIGARHFIDSGINFLLES